MSFLVKVFGDKSKRSEKKTIMDTSPLSIITHRESTPIDEYQILDEAAVKEAQHMDWLSRQAIRTCSVIVECGKQGIYVGIKFRDVPPAAPVLYDLLKKKPGLRYVLLPNVDRCDLQYYLNLNRRSPPVEEVSYDCWESLIHGISTCEELEDANWHDDLVASMRLKAKRLKFSAECMPSEEELIWAYKKTKCGSGLRSVLVEIAMGTKGYLRRMKSPPVEFLAKIDEEVQRTKEAAGRASAQELRDRAAALEAARGSRSSLERKPVPRIERKEPNQRPIFKAEREALSRAQRQS